MKTTVHDIQVDCPKHGKVPFSASSDLGGDEVTMYCPKCVEEGDNSQISGRPQTKRTEKALYKDEDGITLYRRLRSVDEKIQLYEDADGKMFIKTGNFYREIEIDADGHLETMLGRAYLCENIRIEFKKLGREPRGFA